MALPIPCTPGQTQCVGTDMFICQNDPQDMSMGGVEGQLAVIASLLTQIQYSLSQLKTITEASNISNVYTASADYGSQEFAIDANSTTVEKYLNFPAKVLTIYTDADITLRLNSQSNPEITFDVSESPRAFEHLRNKTVTKIYITTGAVAANLKVVYWG